MQCHNISDSEDDENEPKNINNIINKFESKIISLNNKKINDMIDNKSCDFTSQNSRRTKNSSNFSKKITDENKNDNIKFLIEDSSKNISSSIESKSIKTNENSKNININDIEINIDNINNINNNINKVNDNIDINGEIKKISTNQNTKNNQKIFEKNNNSSIYDTSFNMLFNPFDNNKFFFNRPKNLALIKGNDKDTSKIMKNIMNIQENQLKKENDELKNQIINNNKNESKINKDKSNNDKYKNYLYKIFKKKKVNSKTKSNKKSKKKKGKKDIVKINPNSTSNKNFIINKKANWKKKRCNSNFWLNIIRNIIIFIIISSTLTFYSFVFFIHK